MLNNLINLLKPTVSTETKLTGVALSIGKYLEIIDSRLRTQEIRAFIKGDKGDKGDAGKAGIDGKNGKDGIGINGKDGVDGKDGKSGKNGVSVVDSYIHLDGSLMFKLSDGKEIDAGNLPEIAGKNYFSKQLANEQITVSLTAPSNPSLNQLWYDIN